MALNTSFQISFGTSAGDASGHLSAEIDDRADGLNAGKTQFVPGDTAWFLVYKSANVTYSTPQASAGTIIRGASVVVTKEEELSFADTDTATLNTPASALVSYTWLGASLGNLVLVDPTTVKATAKGVAVCRVKYSAAADSWALASPASVAGLTDYSILVYILGAIA
jgi:hypothetical protein